MDLKKIFVLLFILIMILSGCSAFTRNEGDKTMEPNQEQTMENDNTQTDPAELTNGHETANNQESVITNDPNDETSLIGVDKITEQIGKMSLEEKIGQIFIIGFKGIEINEDIRNMIQKYHVGGVILFRSNIESPDQLLTLINSIKSVNSNNKVPLFISVDEEGGRISRMPEQLHKLPSNQIIGEVNNSDLSYEIGGILAEEIKAFGFNLDFAPVLDIFSNPQNTVIGDRAFGTNAEIVSKLGVETMKGIRAGGVIPVVKHFPGHGDTVTDSHVGLPSVNYDMRRLKSFELIPFKAAIDNQADAVMIAHILMNSIDPENPASLSKTVISDILREQMNFSGVVITDDMTMGAIDKNYKISDAAVKSFNAGSDIILVCHGYENQVNAMDTFKAAVQNGTITEDRLNESVYRVLRLKGKYKLADVEMPSINVAEINKKIDAVLSKWYNK